MFDLWLGVVGWLNRTKWGVKYYSRGYVKKSYYIYRTKRPRDYLFKYNAIKIYQNAVNIN